MEEKYCPICLATKPLNKFSLNPDGSVRKHVCKACQATKWRAQLKLEMMEAFGWKCQCCGEDNPHFLTLDHLLNDGNTHREEVKSGSVEVIYSAAKKEGWPKDRYQLLCINCNWAKGKWGVCPHKSGKTTQDVIAELKSKVYHTGKSLQSKENKGLSFGPAASAKVRTEKSQEKKKEEIRNLVASLKPEEFQRLIASYKPN